MKALLRRLLFFWAKTGFAPGWLHQSVDKYSAKLNKESLIRKIYGNSRIRCDLSDHVQSRIYFFGAYEPIEAYLFLDLIQSDMHIVDAGANIGFYSIISAAKLSSRGKVFAFEPIPSNYEQLESNLALSGKLQVEIIKEGLWNQEDELQFSLDQKHTHNHGSFTVGEVIDSGIQLNCRVNTLDSYIDQGKIPKVDLIKMDIEGAELFALQGATQVIKNFQPTLLVEINQQACKNLGYSSEEIDKIFLPLGYKIFRVESLPANSGFIESTKDLIQSNVFYISPKDQSRFKTQWDYKEVKKFFASF